MYPRFLQLFLNNQIENLAAVFNDEYDTPSHTKKVFINMRRQGKEFLGTVTPLFANMLIQSQAVEGKGSEQPTESQHTPTTALPSHVEPIPTVASSSHLKKTQKHRKTKRKATEMSQSSGPTTLVVDETVHEERGDSGSPRCQEAMRDTIAQTRSERVSTPSYDSPLLGVNTPRSDEERIELKELMDMCTKLSDRVLDLKERTSQELHIQNKGLLEEEPIELVEDKCSAEKGVSAAKDKDSTADPVTTASVNRNDVTLAETLMAIRSTKDKGKGIIQEPEKPVKVKGKDQIEYDADVAQRIQAELDEEARLEKEREEEAGNVALIEEWDSIKARLDVDAQLAERLQAEEREQMSVEEQARLLMKFITARKNFFAAKRVEEQRNKPPTKAEQRKKMCTYMKHMS
ncbi:hypothetical protein Tco_1251969 [Tanacetum coccineum]